MYFLVFCYNSLPPRLFNVKRAQTGQGYIVAIYFNNLTQGLKSKLNIFLLYYIVNYVEALALRLSSNLLKIQHWIYQWEILFNHDQTKQAQEVIFFKTANKATHSSIFLNNQEV